jgi:hypothetical protein
MEVGILANTQEYIDYLVNNFTNIVYNLFVVVASKRNYYTPIVTEIDGRYIAYDYEGDFKKSFWGLYYTDWNQILNLGIVNYRYLNDIFSGISITFYMRVDILDTDEWFLFEERTSFRFSNYPSLDEWGSKIDFVLSNILRLLDIFEDSYQYSETSVQRIGYLLHFRDTIKPKRPIFDPPRLDHVNFQRTEYENDNVEDDFFNQNIDRSFPREMKTLKQTKGTLGNSEKVSKRSKKEDASNLGKKRKLPFGQKHFDEEYDKKMAEYFKKWHVTKGKLIKVLSKLVKRVTSKYSFEILKSYTKKEDIIMSINQSNDNDGDNDDNQDATMNEGIIYLNENSNVDNDNQDVNMIENSNVDNVNRYIDVNENQIENNNNLDINMNENSNVDNDNQDVNMIENSNVDNVNRYIDVNENQIENNNNLDINMNENSNVDNDNQDVNMIENSNVDNVNRYIDVNENQIENNNNQDINMNENPIKNNNNQELNVNESSNKNNIIRDEKINENIIMNNPNDIHNTNFDIMNNNQDSTNGVSIQQISDNLNYWPSEIINVNRDNQISLPLDPFKDILVNNDNLSSRINEMTNNELNTYLDNKYNIPDNQDKNINDNTDRGKKLFQEIKDTKNETNLHRINFINQKNEKNKGDKTIKFIIPPESRSNENQVTNKEKSKRAASSLKHIVKDEDISSKTKNLIKKQKDRVAEIKVKFLDIKDKYKDNSKKMENFLDNIELKNYIEQYKQLSSDLTRALRNLTINPKNKTDEDYNIVERLYKLLSKLIDELVYLTKELDRKNKERITKILRETDERILKANKEREKREAEIKANEDKIKNEVIERERQIILDKEKIRLANEELIKRQIEKEKKRKIYKEFMDKYYQLVDAQSSFEIIDANYYDYFSQFNIRPNEDLNEYINEIINYIRREFTNERELTYDAPLSSIELQNLSNNIISNNAIVQASENINIINNNITNSLNSLQDIEMNSENLLNTISNLTTQNYQISNEILMGSQQIITRTENLNEENLEPIIEEDRNTMDIDIEHILKNNTNYNDNKTKLNNEIKKRDELEEIIKDIETKIQEKSSKILSLKTFNDGIDKYTIPNNSDIISTTQNKSEAKEGLNTKKWIEEDGKIKKIPEVFDDNFDEKIKKRINIRRQQFLKASKEGKIDFNSPAVSDMIKTIEGEISEKLTILGQERDNLDKIEKKILEHSSKISLIEKGIIDDQKKIEAKRKLINDNRLAKKLKREKQLEEIENKKKTRIENEKKIIEYQTELKRLEDKAIEMKNNILKANEEKKRKEMEQKDLLLAEELRKKEHETQVQVIKDYYNDRIVDKEKQKEERIKKRKEKLSITKIKLDEEEAKERKIREELKKERKKKYDELYKEHKGDKKLIQFEYLCNRRDELTNEIDRLDKILLSGKRLHPKTKSEIEEEKSILNAAFIFYKNITHRDLDHIDLDDEFNEKRAKRLKEEEDERNKLDREKGGKELDFLPTAEEIKLVMGRPDSEKAILKALGRDAHILDKIVKLQEVKPGKKRGKSTKKDIKQINIIDDIIKESIENKKKSKEDQLDETIIERVKKEGDKSKHGKNIDLELQEKFGKWMDTPILLKNTRIIFNPKQNSKTENKCFIGCTLSKLNNVFDQSNFDKLLRNDASGKIESQLVNSFMYSRMVTLEDVENFAKINSLKYRIWKVLKFENGEEKIINLCLINPKGKKDQIHLLMHDNHFSLVKDPAALYRFINDKQPESLVCHLCFNVSYYSKESLDEHISLCNTPEIGTFKTIDDDKKKMNFTNHKNKNYKSFVIYADIEAILDNSNNRELSKSQTIINDHKPIALGCCTTNFFSSGMHDNKYKVFFGEDCIEKFIEYIRLLEIYCAKFNKKHIGTSKFFNRSYTCHLCNEIVNTGLLVTGNNPCFPMGVHLHEECFKKYYPQKEITIIFHNLKGYDSHFLIDKFSSVCTSFFSIPRSKEKYTFFSGKIGDEKSPTTVKFVDSYAFLQESLDKIAVNIDKNNLRFITGQEWENFPKEYLGLKLAFPYEYITSEEVLNEPILPIDNNLWKTKLGKSDDKFEEKIERARTLFTKTGCKSIKDYMLMYLKVDVYVLLESFEIFRNDIFESFGIDPCYYFTTPGLAWDCALRFIQRNNKDFYIEVPTDKAIISFFTQPGTIRGGISTVSTLKVAESNDNCSIDYYDVTNLYGYAMCKSLPYGGFEFITFPDAIKQQEFLFEQIQTWTEDDEIGYIFEIDVSFLQQAHYYYNDLPPFAEHIDGKLIPNLLPKKNYKAHICIIQQAFRMGGIDITGVSSILRFKQKKWLKDYILHNTGKRNATDNKFLKNFWKLMNNAVYGKSMENVLKRKAIKFYSINDERKMLKDYKDFTIRSYDLFTENLYIAESNEIQAFSKPIYVGFAILEYSKMHMYFLLYKVIKPNLKSSILMYMDTDSFIIRREGEFDLNEELISQWMDIPGNSVSGILGTLKKEYTNKTIKRFYALRSKSYLIKFTDDTIEIKNKGCSNIALSEDDFKLMIIPNNRKIQLKKTQYTILSKNHNLYTVEYEKVVLSNMVDNKRVLAENGICTLPIGSSLTNILFDKKNADIFNEELSDDTVSVIK